MELLLPEKMFQAQSIEALSDLFGARSTDHGEFLVNGGRRVQLRDFMFLNEPEGIAAEEQPKRWISKTGDVYWPGIRALRKTSSGLD